MLSVLRKFGIFLMAYAVYRTIRAIILHDDEEEANVSRRLVVERHLVEARTRKIKESACGE